MAISLGALGVVEDDHVAEPTLDPKAQDAIGRALKAHFEDLMQAPLPDRLLVLLAELQAKEAENG